MDIEKIKEIASLGAGLILIGITVLTMVAGALKAWDDAKQRKGIGSKVWQLLKDIFTNAKATRKFQETLDKVVIKVDKIENEVTVNGNQSLKDKVNHSSEMLEELLAERTVRDDLDIVMRFQMSANGEWYHANPSLLHFFDWSEHDVYGRKWENYTNRKDMLDETGVSYLHRSIQRGESMRPIVRIKNQDGEFYRCWYIAIPVKDKNGNVLRFMGQVEVINKVE